MSLQRLKEIVTRLPQAAQPTFVDGVWRKPTLSAKILARWKKVAQVSGVEWPIPVCVA